MVKVILSRPPFYIPNFKTPSQALRSLTSKENLGVYASSDTLFRTAIFGRDSLEVAEDLLSLRPKLARTILVTLASMQGEKENRINEEEPGKILHEYRRSVVDGKRVDDVSGHIFKQLSARWGGNNKELLYFGSADSTPHFVRVLAKFCRLYGTDILEQNITAKSGAKLPMVSVMEKAVDWLITKLSSSSSGLLEFKNLNPKGVKNQAWKDSHEFYVHEDGKLANHSRPIASIEVQALAYDALVLAADMMPGRTKELNDRASRLRDRTFKHLWLPDRPYFALGLDYDQRGRPRAIKTMTANPAEMLDSFIFDNLSEKERRQYIVSLVPQIMGKDFLTDAGIRSRALNASRVIPFWDYHGSFTSWPNETYDIAKGLRFQGFSRLADELENRLLNIVRAVRTYPEFVYVDALGRVLGTASTARSHGELVFVEGSNRPEKIQAWTVSAIMAIAASRRVFVRAKKPLQLPWQKKLEQEVLEHIPRIGRFKSIKELSNKYPVYPYQLRQKRK